MTLGARLRKLETGTSRGPALPFVEWTETLPLEGVRALRDYLRASIEVESMVALARDGALLGTPTGVGSPTAPPLEVNHMVRVHPHSGASSDHG